MKGKNLYWIKSGFFTVLQNLSVTFFNFGTFFLLVRLLDKDNFGAWGLFLTTITVLEIMRGGLIQNALIKYLAGANEQEHTKIISSSFAIGGGLTLLCIVLNLFLSGYLGEFWGTPELVSMFYMYNLAFILSGIMTQFNCIEQANLKFKGLFVNAFVRQGLFFIYVLTCYIFNIKIELMHLVYALTITMFIGAVISYFYARPYFTFSIKIYPEWIKKLFNYGKYTFGTSVSSILGSTIDQWMIGGFISTSAASVFRVSMQITNLIDIPTNAVAVIVFPQSAKRIESEGKESVKYLYEKSVGTLMALIVPCVLFLFLFSEFVVNILVGKQYLDAVPLLHITLLYCLLTPYGRQCGNILDSIGKTRLSFILILIVASLNIGLNYLLITRIGIMGAVYATLLSNIIGFLIGQYFLRKELNINLFNTLVYAVKFYPEFFNKYIRPVISKA